MRSATLAGQEEVEARWRRGERVVPMALGEVGLPVPALLRRELAAAAGRNTYGPVAGLDALRRAAAEDWTQRGLPTDAEQVVAAPGSKALLFALRRAVGGDVVLPRPSWVSYAAQAVLAGGTAWHVPVRPGEGGAPDPHRLRALLTRARADGRDVRQMLLTLPDNPTGTFPTSETVAELCAAAREFDLVIVCDEIYRDLTFADARVASPARHAPERTVVTAGLSKNLALGGWRLGVARFPDSPAGLRLRDEVLAIASEVWSVPPQPVQHAGVVAFRGAPELTGFVRRARGLHAAVAHAVADRCADRGVLPHRPSAAFYVYPDFSSHRTHLADRWGVRTDADLARVLLERHACAVLPGSAFGEAPEALRLRLATSLRYGADEERRRRALDAEDPLALPWIADAVTAWGGALAELLDG
jgi:aspartate/methionine/tyrosine aminotransferase